MIQLRGRKLCRRQEKARSLKGRKGESRRSSGGQRNRNTLFLITREKVEGVSVCSGRLVKAADLT